MTTEDLSMWPYWRNDKGLEPALVDYFPQTLAGDAVLTSALAQLRVARLAIDVRMSELAGFDVYPRAQSTPQPPATPADHP